MVEEMARASLVVSIAPVIVTEALRARRYRAMICQLGSRVDFPGSFPGIRLSTHLTSP